jgi:hypothetical protein
VFFALFPSSSLFRFSFGGADASASALLCIGFAEGGASAFRLFGFAEPNCFFASSSPKAEPLQRKSKGRAKKRKSEKAKGIAKERNSKVQMCYAQLKAQRNEVKKIN